MRTKPSALPGYVLIVYAAQMLLEMVHARLRERLAVPFGAAAALRVRTPHE